MTDSEKRASPVITHVAWGEMEADGLPPAKDMKLWPGGGREWDWNETGTSHSPGIQPADVEELIEHGAEAVVLSRGMLKRLKTMPETLERLEERGIEVHRAETKEAVETYNALTREGVRVGGLFHSTC